VGEYLPISSSATAADIGRVILSDLAAAIRCRTDFLMVDWKISSLHRHCFNEVANWNMPAAGFFSHALCNRFPACKGKASDRSDLKNQAL
jgi:hypothetical protein